MKRLRISEQYLSFTPPTASIAQIAVDGQRRKIPLRSAQAGDAAASERLIVENTVYEMFTPHTLHTPQALLADLELIRNRGYAFDEEEHELGISCIAAPIKNKQGIAYAAISISITVTNEAIITI